jgi:hypothetical protein
VAVLTDGCWRHLSTEDGLIWNDTDGRPLGPIPTAASGSVPAADWRTTGLPAALSWHRRLPIRSLPGWTWTRTALAREEVPVRRALPRNVRPLPWMSLSTFRNTQCGGTVMGTGACGCQ